ncbi:MAG: hypothetical protein K2W85_07130 [Phycisphaerales bacterium]|nr:hypothetical protein [Phycisphaerales bacterium]
MGVIPTRIQDQIEFGEAHAALWVAKAAQIGLSVTEANAVSAAVGAARAAYDEATLARNAAKAKTVTQNIEVGTLVRRMSDAVQKIRLFAESTNNPGVYAAAEIPEPAAPSPAPPPVQPTNIAAQIEPGGALRIIFKAVNGDSGAVAYVVKRKLAGETGFRVIGTTGTSRPVLGLPRGFRAFVDDTLPGGSNNFQYMIQGQRGTVFGPSSDIFTVVIGNAGDGTQFAELKMAA